MLKVSLVSVINGSVLDVVVDIRSDSKTYGKYILEELNDKNHHQLFIPKGMAHGFLSLEDHTIFNYKCSEFYNKDSEDSIIWNDPDIGINGLIFLLFYQKRTKVPKI